VDDELIQESARQPRLRRASRITLMMAEAARQAIGEKAPARLGIVGAFFTGPCHFSRRFFEPVIERGASFASPALFPETVYNSSLSHLASLFGVDGSCYAVVGDDSAWVTALDVASLWLDLDLVDAVLVVGGEELDASAVEAYAASGWLRSGFVPSEGAAALLVGRPAEHSPRITALTPGFAYRSRSAARRAVDKCLAHLTEAPVARTAAGTWMNRIIAGRDKGPALNSAPGHAFTASAGWRTLLGLQWLAEQSAHFALWLPVWGLHHQVSALRLESPPLARSSSAG
jgi:3-oxoacyl-(acyl-carrier-protein) synthase